MTLSRRGFLTAAPAAIAGIGLMQGAPSLFAQGAAKRPAIASTSRTVALVGDSAPLTPLETARQLVQLVETHALADDNYLEEGAVDALEKAMAVMLGKPDAAFMPTGTLANHVAVRLLCGENRHALVQHDSHLYLDESDTTQLLSGINLVPLAAGKVMPGHDEIAAAIDEAEHGHYPLKVGAISIESPVRRHDGASVSFDQLQRISVLAKQHGIGMHWDGARSLLLSGTQGFDLRRTSALFDTVYVSLYKYLGAPFGAILAGDRQSIAKARELRHVFGGLIKRGWQAALPALDALPGFAGRFIQARAHGEQLLAGLQSAGGFTLQRIPDASNICMVQIAPARLSGLEKRLAAADIRVHIKDGQMMFFTNESILRRPVDQLLKAFVG
ncbi:beta-eliminating lyase-related protein [Rhodanobacter sp. L36]|uniref:threonine aldolase family protein n=1 Tax=Rhodanobacter sp. L36 TaxID=1747221 RepID=UPI00131B1EB0|nr:beta-eliminating lyase-related protein [Rhodanobacter sp. L36]